MKILVVTAMLGLLGTAAAQSADDYRGGWRTDKGEAHTYEFSIRGDKVRGIYCTYCADATTLAFVDGTFGPDGLSFVVTHVKPDGSPAYMDKAIAKLDRGNLTVTGTSGAPGGQKFARTLIKDPRGPDPLPVIVSTLPKALSVPAVALNQPNQQGAGAAPRPRYIQPGPWKSALTEKDVIGCGWAMAWERPSSTSSLRKWVASFAEWFAGPAITPTPWPRSTISRSRETR